MREIKFRAWDQDTRTMIADTGKSEFWGLVTDSATGEITYPVMQYTGLKDRKGIEIYEGDILKRISEWGKVLPDKTEVKWNIGYNYNGWNIARTKNAEVIGNIYETPELLK